MSVRRLAKRVDLPEPLFPLNMTDEPSGGIYIFSSLARSGCSILSLEVGMDKTVRFFPLSLFSNVNAFPWLLVSSSVLVWFVFFFNILFFFLM